MKGMVERLTEVGLQVKEVVVVAGSPRSSYPALVTLLAAKT